MVVEPPYKGGCVLHLVLDYLADREIPAAGFVASLPARFSFSSIR